MKKQLKYDNMDLTNQRFGRLIAVEKVRPAVWRFMCDCGNELISGYSRVLYGQKSCGCLGKECGRRFVESNTTHGESKTKLYRKWRSMISRCTAKNSSNYNRYGGRGVSVCAEWMESFEAFRDWAYANGYDPNLDGHKWSIDRIDNSGNYCPDNCRFTSAYEQQRNRDVTKLYEYNGDMYTASEFADKFGITEKNFVYRRLQKAQTLGYILADWNKIHNVPSHLRKKEDVAKELGVCVGTVTRLIKQGKLNGEKVGRKWYVVHKIS